MSERQILVADDDRGIREMLRTFLEGEDFAVSEVQSGSEVLERLSQEPPSLVLMDVRMPDLSGIEVLEQMQERGLQIPVLVMTAHASASNAIKAIQMGAFEYLTKPFELDDLLHKINACLGHQALQQEVEALRSQVQGERDPNERIIGNSAAMQEVYKTIGLVARSQSSILITGETGTGKELVARTLHLFSDRKHGPWVVVSCSSLPETLLESELFGHEKGSFTSAVQQRKGRFELAHKGTIFLDEVGEMSLSTQKKLLRVLQEREIERVGGSTPIKVDVRVVAATNKDLEAEVANKSFREDLFYRLNVITIRMPALRERKEDIPLLVEHFLDKYRVAPGKPPARITEEAMRALISHDWPGNVRQLENVIQRAAVLSQGEVITSNHLLLEGKAESRFLDIEARVAEKVPLQQVVAEVERRMIEAALSQARGNRSQAARMLGIYRRLLYAKIKEYGLGDGSEPEGDGEA